MIEVARQQVGAAEEIAAFVAALKDEEPAVLEETTEDAAHVHVLAHALHSRAQAADPPRDDVDLRARSGGAIELLDDQLVVQRVDLDLDRRRGTVLCRGSCPADLLDEAVTQVEGSHEQFAEALRLSETRQVVEEVGDIRRDFFVRREQAEVLIQESIGSVIIAGANVRVASKTVTVSPHHERRLRVNLDSGEAVNHVHTGPLELA